MMMLLQRIVRGVGVGGLAVCGFAVVGGAALVGLASCGRGPAVDEATLNGLRDEHLALFDRVRAAAGGPAAGLSAGLSGGLPGGCAALERYDMGLGMLTWSDEQYDRLVSETWIGPGDPLWSELVAFAESSESAFEALHEGVACPTLGIVFEEPPDVTHPGAVPLLEGMWDELVEDWGDAGGAARVFEIEAAYSVGVGDGSRAARALAAMATVSRQPLDVPLYMTQLSGMSLARCGCSTVAWALAASPSVLDDAELALVQAAWKQLDVRGPLADAIAVAHEDFALSARLHEPLVAWAATRDRRRELREDEQFPRLDQVEAHADLTERVVAALRLPSLERVDPTPPGNPFSARSFEGTAMGSARSFLPRMALLVFQAELDRRGVIVGVATLRFVRANERLPASQAELVEAGLLEAIVPAVYGVGELGIAPFRWSADQSSGGTAASSVASAASADNERWPTFMVYDPGPDDIDGGGAVPLGWFELRDWRQGLVVAPPGDTVAFTTSIEWLDRDE